MIDTLWLLVCAILIFLMQPGFMGLESGLTRSKNSINVAVKNLADFGVSVGLFWMFGYALMFGVGNPWWGQELFFLDVNEHLNLAPFFIFQAMFCGTATTIFSGAVAERMKFLGYLVVAIAVSGLIYPIFGHWVWGGLVEGSPDAVGWLRELGFYDFAGSTVVNSVGAWVSLAALLVIGPRAGRFESGQPARKIHGSNLPLSVMGTLLLWFGWLGFNGGSLLTFSPEVAGVLVHTLLAGVAGMVIAGLLGWLKHHLLEVELLIYGSLAGLVSVSASCNVVSTPIAVIIGGVGGAVMLLVWEALEHWQIDDAVGAVAVHAGGGVWGTLAVGLFAQPEILNTGLSKGSQIAVQLLGIGVCFVWAFGLAWLLLQGVDRLTPLRVSSQEEDLGLNVAEHGAKTELYDLFQVMETQAQTQDLSLRVPVEPFTEVGRISHCYNRVIEALAAKNQQIQDYLQQVQQVTAAAAAVEAKTFRTQDLAAVAKRSDGLGKLARVFNHMVETLEARAKELSAARDQLEAVLNAVPGSISWLNQAGIYLGVNQYLAQTFALSPELMVGQPLGSFNSSPDYRHFMQGFLGSDRGSACEEVRIDVGDRARHYLMAAQKYQHGQETVVVGIDVTERHEAQAALQIAEENYRSIFENALEGIFQQSPDGQFLRVNQALAQLYGYDSPEEMLTNITDIAAQIYVDPQQRAAIHAQIMAQGEVKHLEYQVYRKDGSIIWIEENTKAVRDAQGQLLYFNGIIQDITERKQREVELQRQLVELQIEIDEQKRQTEVEKITESDYFKALQSEISEVDVDSFWG
ncbi:MAG: ammonium transporter [Spirulina sp. SIO3F2]|nr:ammonium transporter [Spirulina sp. SIO3F2]